MISIILICIAMTLHAAFLESLCVICFDIPNTRLSPCSHVLCKDCATQILTDGCPFCRQSIDNLQSLSEAEKEVVEALRAKEDREDEARRAKRNEASTDIIVDKFLQRKHSHLVPTDLLKRVTMKNLEKFPTFQGAMKQTFRDGHRLTLKELEKEEQKRKACKEHSSCVLKDNAFQNYVRSIQKGEDRRVESLVRRISKTKEQRRAREIYIREVRKFNDLIEQQTEWGDGKYFIAKGFAANWIRFKNVVRCKFLKLNVLPYTEEEMEQWAAEVTKFSVRTGLEITPGRAVDIFEDFLMEDFSDAERDALTLSDELKVLRKLFDKVESLVIDPREEDVKMK